MIHFIQTDIHVRMLGRVIRVREIREMGSDVYVHTLTVRGFSLRKAVGGVLNLNTNRELRPLGWQCFKNISSP